MCGRYTLIDLAQFTAYFPWIIPADEGPPARYNVAPSQAVPVVLNRPEPRIGYVHWGLIPPWADDPAIGNRMINARAESLDEKPAFRHALRRRRCLVPASGFFEWRKNSDGTKTPLYIRRSDGRPMAFAGLWEVWHSPDGTEVPSCTIITTDSNELILPIHNRMPVILKEEDYRRWLDSLERQPSEVMDLLAPYPAERMLAEPVSRVVNDPKHDTPDCIEPLVEDEQARALPPAKRSRPKNSGDQQKGLFG